MTDQNTSANNDEDCPLPPQGVVEPSHPEPNYFFLRQHGTNHPIGCVALRMTEDADDVKLSISLCAPADFYDKNRGWSRKKAVDAACGKLKSGRLGFILYGNADEWDFDEVLEGISTKMLVAAEAMRLNFGHASEMLRKQVEFIRRRAAEDKKLEESVRGCP